MFQKNLKSFFIVIVLIFFTSCTSSNKPEKIEQKKVVALEVLYRTAYQSFESGNYNDALNLFEQVEIDYSYTEWAPRASLMRSYIYYETANYILALTNLQRFKKRYSGNKNLVYARIFIAMCMFEQINFVALSQEPTELALKQFNKIIKNIQKLVMQAMQNLKLI